MNKSLNNDKIGLIGLLERQLIGHNTKENKSAKNSDIGTLVLENCNFISSNKIVNEVIKLYISKGFDLKRRYSQFTDNQGLIVSNNENTYGISVINSGEHSSIRVERVKWDDTYGYITIS